jgi:hypothetical protein
VAEDADALGLTPDQVAMINGDPVGDFVVDHDNWPAFLLFLDCHTQWIYVVGDKLVRLGLDYSKVLSVMQMRGIKRKHRSEMFDRICLIERGALAGLNNIDLEKAING